MSIDLDDPPEAARPYVDLYERVKQERDALRAANARTRTCARCQSTGAGNIDFHCATCWRNLEAERDALRVENEKLRGAVLRPLDTSDVIAALHEGHAERKVAEHDNAWTSLMRQRDEARAEVKRMQPVYAWAKSFRRVVPNHGDWPDDEQQEALDNLYASIDGAIAKEPP
jgi:hypothetical protein